MNLKTIDDLGNLNGKRILLRADLNVAVSQGKVVEPFRIDATIPTIELLVSKGAKIGIISHIENDEDATLLPIFEYLSKKITLSFVPTIPALMSALVGAKSGEVFLMENVRKYEGEKKNDPALVRELAAVADYYVNDAFSVSHRKHASIVGVPSLLPSAAGSLLIREITELSKAFSAPKPFVVILSGAKFDTKLPLIERFLNSADTIFVGGALANDLLKARGKSIGKSKVSTEVPDLSKIVKAKNVLSPVDSFVENSGKKEMKEIESIGPDDIIFDIGPQTSAVLEKIISKAAFVVWNGPLGVFEKGYTEGTERLAKAIVKSDAYSIVGGGDTIAALEPYNLLSQFSFVSTGGGAMLDFLASGSLLGVEPLVV